MAANVLIDVSAVFSEQGRTTAPPLLHTTLAAAGRAPSLNC
ncbi:hypothetical protein PM8797T_30267 [Gimesia maris DSM 8797]|nr:hypothetical protein PM8797T_30267 [Gimesia maris DSM 8797]